MESLAHRLRLLSPRARLAGERQRLDALALRLERAMQATVRRAREKLAAQAGALERANPLNLLARGYAILSDPITGARLRSAAQIALNANLDVHLADGRLRARVEGRTLHTDSAESESQ